MTSYFVVPPFDDTKSRYNMHTFRGRAWHFYRATNPVMMFETDRSIAMHKKRIEEFKRLKESSGGAQNYETFRGKIKYSDAELWYSRSVIEGCVHPVTKQTIFPLFRFAAFAPLNLAIVPLMLAPSTIKSKWRTMGVHVLNQTVNAVVNYSNRSSDDIDLKKLFAAYSAAVVSSCSLALSANYVMSKISDANSFKATVVRGTLPFSAVVAAGFCNLALMRSEEWLGNGVPIRAATGDLHDPVNDDNNGELLGYSRAAGKLSIAYCTATRVTLNFWAMMLPPFLLTAIFRSSKLLQGSPFLSRQVEAAVLGTIILLSVPPSLAVMKPVVTTSVSKLEPQFQNLSGKDGKRIENVTFYKGL
jgi:hypothetical protein